MNGHLVGAWAVKRGAHSFAYAPDWRSIPQSRSLSLSMPLGAGGLRYSGDVVKNYFDNLLPDADHIRKRIQKRHRTASLDAFELLAEIGRDCVGAVQLLPEGEEPTGFDRIKSVPLTDNEVERHLLNAMSPAPLGTQDDDDDDFRISIAGAQEKTALLRLDGQWHLPLGMTPTTHILKLPLGHVGRGQQLDLRTSVENEWLCLHVLDKLGLKVANTEIATFGRTKVLVVERFDRVWSKQRTWIARVPQEDFCQVLGVNSANKYQSKGGPGIKDIMGVLAGSARRDEDRSDFLVAQFAFWLLAATDGHAKNFSVSIGASDAFTMTPLYDVLSAWPVMGPQQLTYQKAKLAMAIRGKNAHYRLVDIRPDHWRTLAIKSGLPATWNRMKDIAMRVAPTFDTLGKQLPQDFPAAVFDSISAGTQKHAALFLRGVEAAEKV